MAAQAGTNLANVSFNYKAGRAAPADKAGGTAPAESVSRAATPAERFDASGSSAPVRQGMLSAVAVRRAAVLAFAIAAASGITAALLTDPRLLWVGVAGVTAGWGYSAPPIRLAYRALGVITVFMFFGPAMVLGTHYLATGASSSAAAVVALAIGLLAANVMHVNDLRDLESDREHGKHTLAAIIGRPASIALIVAMVIGAAATIVVAVSLGTLPRTAFAALLGAPLAWRELRVVACERDFAALNRAWFLAVKLHGASGGLLIAGLVIAATIH